jgi:hypothetical protein
MRSFHIALLDLLQVLFDLLGNKSDVNRPQTTGPIRQPVHRSPARPAISVQCCLHSAVIFQPAFAGLCTTILQTAQFHDGFTLADRLVRFFHTAVGTTIA